MGLDSKKRTIYKTLTDKVLEIVLSSIILYLLGFSIELTIGLPIFIEMLQVGIYVLNERMWSKTTWETLHEYHLCEPNKCPLKVCLCPYHKKEIKK